MLKLVIKHKCVTHCSQLLLKFKEEAEAQGIFYLFLFFSGGKKDDGVMSILKDY